MGKELRNENIASRASELAKEEEIRNAIIKIQRNAYVPEKGLIADGRDMGTVIFPDANLKIFLTASLEERAKRREQQLKRQGMEVNMRVLLEELEDRDQKDREREHSPLVAAKDSVELDTTNIKPEGVIKKIKALPFFN